MRRLISFFFILSFYSIISSGQGYRIELKVDGLRDTTIQLGFYFGEKTLLADTAPVDSKGVAVFKGDTILDRGMYFVVLPGSYFELLLGDNQHFGIETSLDKVNEDLVFIKSPENTKFAEYRLFMGERQQRMAELQKEAQAQRERDEEVDEALLNQIKELDAEVKKNGDKIIAEQPKSFLASIIKTLRPIEFPDFKIPDDAANADSLRWMASIMFNQQHFFDNIEFSEPGLVRTPFFQGRIDTYFDRILIPAADTVMLYADRVIERSRSNPLMFRFVLNHLFTKFSNSSIMGLDAVFVHIAEKYYLTGEADWINEESKTKIANRVADLKPNLIGKVAPNLTLKDIKGLSRELHKVKADVLVVYFWEPSCSHCKKVTPELNKLYAKYKSKGLEVYAVYTQDDMAKWTDYVKENGLSWINVWDPSRASRYHKLYDIYSTPVIYILNKDKKIIAKRIGVESLERFIEQEVLNK